MSLAFAEKPGHAVTLGVETGFDRARLDSLIADAFGPGRFAKTAERLREKSERLESLCFCARIEGEIVGGVRLWRIDISGVPGVFLGPIAVDPRARRGGIGAKLVGRAVADAFEHGFSAVLLVGDVSFFKPLGFESAPEFLLPGPVDPARVMIVLAPGASRPAPGRVQGVKGLTQ